MPDIVYPSGASFIRGLQAITQRVRAPPRINAREPVNLRTRLINIQRLIRRVIDGFSPKRAA